MQVQIELAISVQIPFGLQLPERKRMLQLARAAVQYLPNPLIQAVQDKFPCLTPPLQRSIAEITTQLVALQQLCIVGLAIAAAINIAVIRSLRRRKLLLEDQISTQESRRCQNQEVQTISDDEQEGIQEHAREWWSEQREATSPFRSVRYMQAMRMSAQHPLQLMPPPVPHRERLTRCLRQIVTQ